MEHLLPTHLYITIQNTSINVIFNLTIFKRKNTNPLKSQMKAAPRMKAVKFTNITPTVQV